MFSTNKQRTYACDTREDANIVSAVSCIFRSGPVRLFSRAFQVMIDRAFSHTLLPLVLLLIPFHQSCCVPLHPIVCTTGRLLICEGKLYCCIMFETAFCHHTTAAAPNSTASGHVQSGTHLVHLELTILSATHFLVPLMRTDTRAHMHDSAHNTARTETHNTSMIYHCLARPTTAAHAHDTPLKRSPDRPSSTRCHCPLCSRSAPLAISALRSTSPSLTLRCTRAARRAVR